MKARVAIITIAFWLAITIGAVPAHAEWVENGVPACAASGNQVYVRMVHDGMGGAILAWRDYRNGANYDVYAQRIDRFGTALWGENGVPVSTASNHQYFYDIVTDGEGGAIIVWQDHRVYSLNGSDIYAQRIDASGTPCWTTNGIPISYASLNQRSPRMVPDGEGGALIAWFDYDDILGLTKAIYMQRVNGAGEKQLATNGVCVWVKMAITSMQDLDIAPDENGGAILLWSETEWFTIPPQYFDRLYVMRINAAGGTVWGAHRICDGNAVHSNNIVASQVISDGDGGAYVAWHDFRNDHADLFAQHVTRTGSVIWTGNGRPICTLLNSDYSPQMALDGDSGVYIVWERYGGPWIYAQRLDYSGNLYWQTNGIPLREGNRHDRSPQIVSDNDGGAVIVWQNTHYKDEGELADIVSNRIDSNGNQLWESTGTYVCHLPSSAQEAATIIPNPLGGGIFAWEDWRDGTDSDIYVQWFDRNGENDLPSPVISSVSDVGPDQGGLLRVTITASPLDDPVETENPILLYCLWRKTADGTQSMMTGFPPGEWESLTTIPAMNLPSYEFTIHTGTDLSGAGEPWEVFVVTAHISIANNYFISGPDSGYSIDNLPPAMPAGLNGEAFYGPPSMTMEWESNDEPDFSRYAVYRGTVEDFVPGAGNLLCTTPDTTYFDDYLTWSNCFYKVSAIDRHDNESPYALLRPDDFTDTDPTPVPDATFLAQNFPNPFNPNTTIVFGLKTDGFVNLSIYDAAGRLVAVLIDESRPAGPYATVWNGKDQNGSPAASGVYFYRLISKEFEETRKMILLR